MKHWNFYFSGILYGTISAGSEELMVRRLEAEKGCLGEVHPWQEEDEAYFAGLCRRSIRGFFGNLPEYEEKIKRRPPFFVTENGEEFTVRKGTEYIQRRKRFPMDLLCENGTVYAAVMSGRDSCGVLVRRGMERRTPLAAWEEAYGLAGSREYQPGQVRPVRMAGTFFVPTRDGERLATDVYLPAGPEGERVPAVLVRTPYGRKNGASAWFRFAQRGYGVVIQDTRGREDSTGRWLPEYYEAEDGDDTLNWIASREWSTGSVAMAGGSYLGYVQWAAASTGNPHLKAMLSSVCAGSAFGDFPRRGGCFNSGIMAWAFAMSEQRMRGDLMEREDWDRVLDIRPLADLPEKALGHPVDFLSCWLEHRDLDEFWKKTDWKGNYRGKPVPALIMSGWFDDNGMGTTEALELTETWPEGTWKAVLGPWKHSGNGDYDIHGQFMGENALRYDIDLLCMKWLDHFLKGTENGVEKTAAVEYYTVGENCWKTAGTWPPEICRTVRLYLEGEENGTGAGTGAACGAGKLKVRKAGSDEEDHREAWDFYVYDPEHPAVHLVDMSENELSVPEDYTEEENRTDVLSYTTEPFQAPFTVTGEAKVHLLVSCDCPDTDFVVRITDVDENGRSVKLADGVLGAKYRNGFENPEYMEPGAVYEIPVRTTKISNCFLPGHCLRLTVTSGAKNLIFPNSNTENGFDSEEKRAASVRIHRGGRYASFVEVPVERKNN